VRPLRLQIAGLRSWTTERELHFTDVDLAAVVGRTGAGKSSILEAIVYALYNTSTYERRAGSLISSDAKTMSVTLDFEADGDQWRVTRAMSRGSYPPSVHKLTCLSNPAEHPMEEGEQAVNAAIQQLIGLDREQFLTAVLLPQGRFQTLLMATPGVRSAILKGVFRLDELDELRELAGRIRRDEVEPILDTARHERSLLLPDPEGALVQAAAEIERCTTTLDSLTEIKGRYDEVLQRAADLRQEAATQRERATSIETAADLIPNLDAALELDAELSQQEAELRRVRDEHATQRAGIQTQLESAAKAGVTVETLVSARSVLQNAKTSLPKLDTDGASLREAIDSLASDKTSLADVREAFDAQRAELATSEASLPALKDAADGARATLSDATEKLRDLRAAAKQRETVAGQLQQLEQQFGPAQAVSNQAASEAAAAKAAAEGAEAVFEAARAAHEAAHLAAGLKPGESCPVCRRELPDDFTAPEAPSVLGSAKKEADRLRKAHDEAADTAAKAAAKVEALTEQAGTCRDALTTAERNEAGAYEAAEPFFTHLDLARADTDLLAAHVKAVNEAAADYEAAGQAVAAKAAQVAAEERAIGERSRSLEDRDAQLAREGKRIQSEREAITTALEALPADYRPTSNATGDLEEAESRCGKRLSELQELDKSARAATAEIEKIDGQIAVVLKSRTDEIDSPRREATTDARDLSLKLREAKQSLKLPKQPADTAALSAHADWVARIVELAQATASELKAEATAAESSAGDADKAAEKVLKAATKVAERALSDAVDFQRELDSRRAALLAAERARDMAADQIPKAALLDQRIAQLASRRDALDELATCLGDGHFIGWLVQRRQQLLLAVSSEIFAAMTGDRYRFASDFTIIDGRTGAGRAPSTLSGGESFMASLSLALGMAEIAARGGGRIGSLYLDEGFGTLDPNTLDEAITALELRARSGQMILIVSHVPAMAQRIDRVLQVRPDATGAVPEWLDDYDRDSLLLDAVAAEIS
jgi:exonuclease SbcC